MADVEYAVFETQPKGGERGFYSDPAVVGAGALLLGFAVGSGRWNNLGVGALRVMESLVNLGLVNMAASFRKKNPRLRWQKEGSKL